jgi:hypothetical protein
MNRIKSWIRHHWLISLILFIGATLRFWKFWSIPYSHDELSALNRTGFSSFSELIEGAVRSDGHPAGTQILLWFQSMISFEEAWIKLPFLIAGVWSIWLIYLVAKRLFSESSGILAAALIATLQYPITFSQWARPYVLGLLVVLLLTYILLRFREAEGKGLKYVVLFAILAAAAGYIHYFALLQVILITIGFIPLLNSKKWAMLSLGGVLSFLLWVPHLGITIDHLSHGGIGDWLQPPGPNYWQDCLSYAFQFSWWPIVIVGIAGLAMLAQVHIWVRSYVRWMLVGLAILPFVIAYYYSINVNPLLHQSVLIFSFPFLLLWMVSFVRVKGLGLIVVAFILSASNVSTLVVERDHYELNYGSEYGTALEWGAHLSKREPSLATLVDLRPGFIAFLDKNQIIPPFQIDVLSRNTTSQKVQQFLDEEKAPLLFFAMDAGSSPELLASALDHYPCIEEHKYFHAGEAYLLSKTCDSRTEISKSLVQDEMVFPDNPYSSGWEWKWTEIDSNTNTHFVADFRGVMGDAFIVAEVKSTVMEPAWRGVALEDSRNETIIRQKGYHVIYNSEMERDSSDVLKSFVWLGNGGGIELYSFRVFSVPKNTNKFRLFRK